MSENVTRQTSLVPVPSGLDDGLRRCLQALFENVNVLMGQAGDPLDGAARFRDLTRAGVLQAPTTAKSALANEKVLPANLQPAVTPITSDQLSRPPVPSGLTAAGGFDQIYLSWDSPNFPWLGGTEVWRANDDNLSHAAKIGTTSATVYVDKLGGDESEKYYWIRHISRFQVDGAPDGPFNAEPAVAQLALNVNYLISVLSQSYAEAHPDVNPSDVPLLFIVRPVVTVGGEQGEMVDMGDGEEVFVPSGVYITRAAIANATITTAQVKDLSADKITTGTIAAGETITVGGAIRGGKDAYADTVPGWWIGDDGGTFKLIIGDATNFMRWNGSALEVRGDVAQFDDLSANQCHFNEADTDLAHSTVHYVDALILSDNDGKLLVPSTSGAALAFDDPDRSNYLCYAGAIYAGGTTANSGGDDNSAYVTPAIYPSNEPDINSFSRCRDQLSFAASVSFTISTYFNVELRGAYVAYNIRRQLDGAIVESDAIVFGATYEGQAPAYALGLVAATNRSGGEVVGLNDLDVQLLDDGLGGYYVATSNTISGRVRIFKTNCVPFTSVLDAFRIEITGVTLYAAGATLGIGASARAVKGFDLYTDNGSPFGAP